MLSGPAAPYSHLLHDDLRAACIRNRLRVHPPSKQVWVKAIHRVPG
jgi:hypothetical protein